MLSVPFSRRATRCLQASAPLAVLAFPILTLGCGHASHRQHEATETSTCGPELPRDTVLDIARAAIKVTGGDPSATNLRFELSVHSTDCDYLVSGVSRDLSTAHFAILINRSGNVVSWPWCCVPEFFVFTPAEPK